MGGASGRNSLADGRGGRAGCQYIVEVGDECIHWFLPSQLIFIHYTAMQGE